MTKHELKSVLLLKYKIIEQESYIEDLKHSAENLVPAPSDMPRSLDITKRVENLAIKLVDAENKLAELRAQLAQAKLNLIEKIFAEVSDPTLRKFVLLRYIECLPYKDIAHRMKYTLRHVYRLREKFLNVTIWTA